jgi:hypothetical protein
VRPLSSSDLLDLWEDGSRLHPLDRGLLALGAAHPETPYQSLADWPLGRRNAALAELHCAAFGPGLQAWISCPQCGEKLEFQMDGRTLVAQEQTSPNQPIDVNGHSFRLPTSRDLARAARETDPRLAAIRLLESCRKDANGASQWSEQKWSEQDLEEVGEKMARADPMAEIRLTFRCPQCNSEWDEALDIAAFLWTEIDARAKRLLWEVDAIAARYGWSESEILSLSEPRRARYLEMVKA